MNKNLVLGLGLFFGLSASSVVADDSGTGENSQAVCAAVTTCVSPFYPAYSISCRTYGAGCTWWVSPNQAVQCTGYDFYGNWVTFAFTCR